MTQDQGPRTSTARKLMRVSLAALLSCSQTAPVFAQGAAALTARTAPGALLLPGRNPLSTEAQGLHADLLGFLQGKGGTLADLKARQQSLAVSVEKENMPADEREALRAEVQ